jgi:hypothetical protein
MVMVVHLADPGEIVRELSAGQITRTGAIGALVSGGRTLRQAVEILSWATPPSSLDRAGLADRAGLPDTTCPADRDGLAQ